jgi:hypothetical protein
LRADLAAQLLLFPLFLGLLHISMGKADSDQQHHLRADLLLSLLATSF